MPVVASGQRRPTGILSFFLSLMKPCCDSPPVLLVWHLMNMITQGFWSSITKRWGMSGTVGAKSTFQGQGR